MKYEREKRSQPLSLAEVSQRAKEVTLKDGEHAPTLMVEGNRAGSVMQFTELAPTHEGRAQQMFTAGFWLAQQREIGSLSQVFFITEAWMSASQGGQLPTVMPSQDPQRLEVLIISQLQVVSQRKDVAIWEMQRNPEGQLVQLVAFNVEEDKHQIESPLLSAFTAGFRVGSGGGKKPLH